MSATLYRIRALGHPSRYAAVDRHGATVWTKEPALAARLTRYEARARHSELTQAGESVTVEPVEE